MLFRSLLGLILTPCPGAPDPMMPLYHTGWSLPHGDEIARVVRLGHDLGILCCRGPLVSFEWEVVHIAIRPPSMSNSMPRRAYPGAAFPPFRLSQHVFRHLIRSGWELSRRPTTSDESTGLQSVDFFFCRASPGATRLVSAMGQCSPTLIMAISSSESSSVDLSRHWASFWVISEKPPGGNQLPLHNCPADHIALWSDHRRLFTEQYSEYYFPFVVRFTSCPMNPRDTLVLSQAIAGLKYRFGLSGFAVKD